MSIIREVYHPKAYLSNIKNVKLGLRARTIIVNILEKQSTNAMTIAKESGKSYGVIIHHLRLLCAEGTVERKGKKPYTLVLTGLGQKRLID